MASERDLFILEYLLENGKADVKELSKLLHVHESTIRRELTGLEKNGLLVRSHGGARLVDPIQYELPYKQRASQHLDAKRKIATAAKKLVDPNMMIGISGGTTCTEFARQLLTINPLTIVTNAVNIAVELQGQREKKVLVTGGVLNQISYELIGGDVADFMQKYHLDLAFLGASGIDTGFGISVSDNSEAVSAQAIKSAAARTVLLADHSKIGKVLFARLCSLTAIDLIITDDGISKKQLSQLEQAGVSVFVAGREESAAAFSH